MYIDIYNKGKYIPIYIVYYLWISVIFSISLFLTKYSFSKCQCYKRLWKTVKVMKLAPFFLKFDARSVFISLMVHFIALVNFCRDSILCPLGMVVADISKALSDNLAP